MTDLDGNMSLADIIMSWFTMQGYAMSNNLLQTIQP